MYYCMAAVTPQENYLTFLFLRERVRDRQTDTKRPQH